VYLKQQDALYIKAGRRYRQMSWSGSSYNSWLADHTDDVFLFDSSYWDGKVTEVQLHAGAQLVFLGDAQSFTAPTMPHSQEGAVHLLGTQALVDVTSLNTRVRVTNNANLAIKSSTTASLTGMYSVEGAFTVPSTASVTLAGSTSWLDMKSQASRTIGGTMLFVNGGTM
jgi:hypothetical protein